jgi:endonuclease-3
MSPPTFRRRILNAHRQLVKLYGEPKHRPRRDALSQLIATILSQNTSDVNTARAFDNLRAQFSTWEAVRDAPTRAVVRAIRSAGLANTKAPRIQAILRQLTTQHHVEENKTELDSRMSRDSASGRERGSLSLDFLRVLPVGEAKAYLLRLKGVGPKTASIVLLFTFGMPAFPVDTHIFRVTKRLGWIEPRVSREQAHAILESLIPSEIYYPLHLNLIRLGREICPARKPRCEVCPLTDLCEYYAKVR